MTITSYEEGYGEGYGEGREDGAKEIVDAAPIWLSKLIQQDARFRLTSVLKGVQQQKQEKLIACAIIQSVLTQISAQKLIHEKRGPTWGDW